MDTILWPIMWLISWVIYGIHHLLVMIGFHNGSGPAWVLSILGLTIIVRLIILPLYNKQIKSQREMQVLQPQLQKLQQKYKGKRDAYSQRRMQEEMTALYRDRGTSPFASCFPLLIQMPVLFALFRVLYAFPQLAAGTYKNGGTTALGPITRQVALDFENSTFFGAPLSASLSNPNVASGSALAVRIVVALLVIAMIATMFFTQKQLLAKNMPESAMDPNSQAYKMQKYMLYGMPLIYVFSGAFFQVGVLVYWVAGNLWTWAQQTWFIRNNPTPGSPAYKERQKRLRAKAEKKGIDPSQMKGLDQPANSSSVRNGDSHQRVQPLGKARSKKAAAKQAHQGRTASPQSDENSQKDAGIDQSEVRGKDGLTDAERARKRYERRQAERARARAKKKRRTQH